MTVNRRTDVKQEGANGAAVWGWRTAELSQEALTIYRS